MNSLEEVNPECCLRGTYGQARLLLSVPNVPKLVSFLLTLDVSLPLGSAENPGSKELKVDGWGGWLYYASC